MNYNVQLRVFLLLAKQYTFPKNRPSPAALPAATNARLDAA